MRAHFVSDSGVIMNTIEVESLDFMPGLVDAAIGGTIGDSIINGMLVKAPNSGGTMPFEQQKEEYLDTVRDMREKLLIRLNGYGTQLMLAEPPENAAEKALCNEIIQGLLDITTIEPVLTATTVGEVKTAVKAEYARLVGRASEDMNRAFRKVDL
jgi:hypothetical protein